MSRARTMDMRNAVRVVHEGRRDCDVVVASMGAAREWMSLGPLHERDLVLVPSAMGHATSMGLGLALAQPARRVIVLSGDGSLLMNLGTFVTIAGAAASNLRIVVFANGVYEVTGGQPTPAANADVDYVAIAMGCGIESVHRIRDDNEWRDNYATLMDAPGPTVVILDVAPVTGAGGPRSPGPAGERAKRFAVAVQATG